MTRQHRRQLASLLRLACAALAGGGMLLLPANTLGYEEAGDAHQLMTGTLGRIAIASGIWLACGRPLLAWVARTVRRDDVREAVMGAAAGARVGLWAGAAVGICLAVSFVDLATHSGLPTWAVVTLAGSQAAQIASLWSAAGAVIGTRVPMWARTVRSDTRPAPPTMVQPE